MIYSRTNHVYIFLVFSPLIEIVVSRIIETNLKNIPKKSVLIIHPHNYKPNIIFDVNFYCFDELSFLRANLKNKKFNSQALNLKIQYFLYYFRKLSKKFGKRVYARLGKLPVSLKKIYDYSNIIKDLKLDKKQVSIYTPNVKVHIFQILLFYTQNSNYHLIEEGSASFKNINDTELLFNKNIKIFIADIFSYLIFIFSLVLRTIFDFFRIFLKSPKLSIRLFKNYFQLPIFRGGLFYLNRIKPISIHRISPKAFASFHLKNKNLYLNKSCYEITKKENAKIIINNLGIKKLDIIVLSGDNINILKDEFNNDEFNKYCKGNIIIRPHPNLSYISIFEIAKYLNIKSNKNLIDLSEKLRNIPIEILMDIQNISIKFLGKQKSSLIIYSKTLRQK